MRRLSLVVGLLLLSLTLAGCTAAGSSPSDSAGPTDGTATNATSARFPSALMNVGGVAWAGVSPLCGLMVHSQFTTGANASTGPIMHVGSPTTGYICVGADWTKDTSQSSQGSVLWVAPQRLAAVDLNPAGTGTAQAAASATVDSNPNVTYADWSQQVGANSSLSTLPGYPQILVDPVSWPDSITVYTLAYQISQTDGYSYFLYYFDDPSQPGQYRLLTFAFQTSPDATTWQTYFGQADSATVMGMVTLTYRWRPSIGASGQDANAGGLDLYNDCTQPADAALAVCLDAFNPTLLPTLI